MPEDHTNVAIPFRLLYGGKSNFWKVLILASNRLIHIQLYIVSNCSHLTLTFHVIFATILVTYIL
jgi:hypothetical protein